LAAQFAHVAKPSPRSITATAFFSARYAATIMATAFFSARYAATIRKKTINTDGEFVMAQSPQQPQQSPHERSKKFPLVHHHEAQETFVDQLGLFTFDGGTLRMELAVARMNEPKPPAQPTGERHIVARLVMSAPCAIDVINQMQLIAAQLAQAGLIKMERPPTSVQPTEKAN